MKTVFIVNPTAGRGKNIDRLIKSIKCSSAQTGKDVEIYKTKCAGDASNFVKNYCMEKGAARFIACGGDGTFSEVVNGASGCGSAEIGVVPSGTGNDFCRNFDKNFMFDDIAMQIKGKTVRCDAIKYTTVVGGEVREGYCANMFNIGFDCKVADRTADIKKKTVFGGSLAYFISILLTLVAKKSTALEIEADGILLRRGDVLLTSVANGSYCGGGIKSNPLADVNDGLINFNIIKNISRLKFISLLPYYMKGTVLSLRNVEKIITSEKCRELIVTPLEGNIRMCVDGEIIDAGKTRFEIVHNAFNFVVPQEPQVKEKLLSEQNTIRN